MIELNTKCKGPFQPESQKEWLELQEIITRANEIYIEMIEEDRGEKDDNIS